MRAATISVEKVFFSGAEGFVTSEGSNAVTGKFGARGRRTWRRA